MGTPLTKLFGELTQSQEPDHKPDQRRRSRYPISLDLKYKLLRGGRIERSGTGKSVNISSGGVLFETEDPLPSRGMVEIALQWPFLLQGNCGLKLVVRGRIVRSNGASKETAIRSEFHEFRTAGVQRTNCTISGS